MSKFIHLALALALAATSVFADQVALRQGHPDRYVVVKGDTLWDISARFLDKPWLWPEIWYVNPQIENPHLIYPGDVISLVYVDGKPQLRLERGKRTVRLSPRVRAEALDQAIPTIPLDAIRQFLSQPLVVGKDELKKAAYVVSSAGEHLIAGAGDRVYVRGLDTQGYSRFNAFRPGDTYVDPDSGEVLGYEAIFLGEGTLERDGDPATLDLKRTTRELVVGDRVLPAGQDEVTPHFQPHAPSPELEGTIISVLDGVTQIGQYQIVVINRGSREGVDAGTVLAVHQAGETIKDVVAGGKVTLPDERAGLLMVFRPFEKVSYALVMKATAPLHVGDRVRHPDL